MKQLFCVRSVIVVFAIFVGSAKAEITDGQNWADSVRSHTDYIQNFGWELMSDDPNNEDWVLGKSDADVDENGYAWDTCDEDLVAGWRTSQQSHADANIVVKFDTGLPDYNDATDLVIHVYGGPFAEASVWASVDGNSFMQIGIIGGGTPGYLRDEMFDFNGAFTEDVYYVKVQREAAYESGTGIFFDSFASLFVLETCADVWEHGYGIDSDFNQDCRVNFPDYAIFANLWMGYTELGDPNYVDWSDLAEIANDWLRCNDPNDRNCERTW